MSSDLYLTLYSLIFFSSFLGHNYPKIGLFVYRLIVATLVTCPQPYFHVFFGD